ncbi:MAG: DNA mismatch repair protein MutS [Lachnospiraceae bacterium]|nr:DNA mismatch repair protein MutS [Lachnospiraceae bacterium]MDY5704901.1 DNA mismatch repair protein MutS [Lachnospiraceae bacterium]
MSDISDVNINDVTPMMQHYIKMKAEYKDAILFYRLGDFYEMFFEDAKIVSRELELTLTGKNCGLPERAPMCGVPFHAADSYINRLVNKGYKVAICEQLEDPKDAKGIVKRGVIRVVTPGTNIDTASLDETKNNYLMSVVFVSDRFGIAISDVSTGDFYVTEESSLRSFLNEMNKYKPTEIICNEAFQISGIDMDELRDHRHISVSVLDNYYFEEDLAKRLLTKHFKVSSLKSLDLEDEALGTVAAGATFQYLKETQKSDLNTITHIEVYRDSNYMMIDSSSRRNLELTETLRDKEKRGSLLWVLDHTRTAMGARRLRSDIEQPLRNKEDIEARLDAVEDLLTSVADREEIREYLGPVYDLERLMTRISYKTANPRDLVAFRNSIQVLPGIKQVLENFSSAKIRGINNQLDPLSDLYQLVESAIAEEPPISVHDGGILREGYRADVDELRSMRTNGKTWLANLEETEREKTGIKNLRIRYNKVFGYFIEVTNSYKELVPDRYIRKQTLTNAERFYTDELKEMEDKILGSEDRLTHLENQIYFEILSEISSQVERIQKTAKALSQLDVLISLAITAEKNHYCRPRINENGTLKIEKGRHPVVEKMIPAGTFIDNDTILDNKDNRMAIITGPNMAGKSTYMRQTALIVLMAQIGSFVPAKSANISIVDRIFTRVGASDDLASGQSTFMVEMNEVANILMNATKDSLLILDEIGRGTSTFDGLSIAWAVVEYVSNPKLIGAKTLFATHYHELTELEGKLPGVHNYCSAVKEGNDGIVFLRKIVTGGADRSYGIEVAKLAGLPEAVIDRATELQEQLANNDLSQIAESIAVSSQKKDKKKKEEDDLDFQQLSFFATETDDDIIQEIRDLDLSNMTPLDALNQLNRIQNKVKNRW